MSFVRCGSFFVQLDFSLRWGGHSCLPRERAVNLADKNVCPTGHNVAHFPSTVRNAGSLPFQHFGQHQ